MGLAFSNIRHAYGNIPALTDISLRAEAGEILCLLGPSGCGKSTLLNLAAGILPVQAGEITLDKQILASAQTNPPPERRAVGLVFQDGALFPHMTVADNIGFGVSDKSQRPAIVAELLDQIGLAGFADRYPHTLSGGQRQRVAIARALAPAPKVLLMDEPFASIDIMLRRRLREEMRRLLKARDCITILVTHDPEEAIETGDQIAVMEAGRIVQCGTSETLYADPQSLMVGLLMGEGSILSAQREGKTLLTAFGALPASALANADALPSGDGPVDLLIRPLSLGLSQADKGARIVDLRRTGTSQLVTLEAGDEQTLIQVAPHPAVTIGSHVTLSVEGAPLLAFPASESLATSQ